MSKTQKFYVVWKGRRTGVFATWDECQRQVSGFPGAQFKAFESQAAAQAAWRGAYQDFVQPQRAPAPVARRPQLDAYAVDASCPGNPGPVEFRCVHTDTGAEVFRRGPFADGTNNLGEFLGLVEALAWCHDRRDQRPIYSDSATALGWVRKKSCRTQLERTAANRQLFQLVDRAERWLQEHPVHNPLLKWETDAWGENPADFGRK